MQFPTFELAKKAVCRLGYDTDYPPIRYFDVGERLNITGRNRQKTWLKLEDCWDAASLGKIEGDLEAVPVLIASTPHPGPGVARLHVQSQQERL